MVGLVWETISGAAFLLAGVVLALGLLRWPPFVGQQKIEVGQRILGVLLIVFGTYILDMARRGYVLERGGRAVRYR